MTIQSMRPQLTENDIIRLMKGETSEERASVAHRLCRRISIDALSEEEREYADEIIQILAADATELVRRTLSVTLRNSPKLPREVALKLAKDVESVALPVLENSPVFSDEDLCELVLAVTAAKQAAIAWSDLGAQGLHNPSLATNSKPLNSDPKHWPTRAASHSNRPGAIRPSIIRLSTNENEK